ncbi:MAG: helix-turn-helix transcriptional regulator [Myxococcales bacterium]|nr:helix-turn-helix transcriptional regulator [Myxococcales bacterium]
MPRRDKPDPLAKAIGQRIRQLREEAGLTLEKLAYESELGSKGHLSNLERGLVRPTAHTLRIIADRLGVLVLDLVTFPDEDDRQAATDELRRVKPATLRRLLKDLRAEQKKQAKSGSARPVRGGR